MDTSCIEQVAKNHKQPYCLIENRVELHANKNLIINYNEDIENCKFSR